MKGNAHSRTVEYIFATGKSQNTDHLSCLPGTVLPDLDLIGKNAPVGQAQHGAAFPLSGEHLL